MMSKLILSMLPSNNQLPKETYNLSTDIIVSITQELLS